ncbi:putative chromodomain Y-like protein 2 [Apostichopus japonicus]|uniref:Putative chromodomain Y-like protein 2 n=1 Tax=Stichopus japonicus TaxID=307972 RepID=A0A2G8K5W6_STIJA|nr:putative chromodomain Y-like protein 2 [Apostichopus japonicus]
MAGGDEFEVGKILGKRTRNGKTKYKIRWKGFDESEDTWEPEENLTHCSDLLDDYNNDRDQDMTIINQTIASNPNMNGSVMRSPMFSSTPATVRRVRQKETMFAQNRRYINGNERKDAIPSTRIEEDDNQKFTDAEDKPAGVIVIYLALIFLVAFAFYQVFTRSASS